MARHTRGGEESREAAWLSRSALSRNEKGMPLPGRHSRAIIVVSRRPVSIRGLAGHLARGARRQSRLPRFGQRVREDEMDPNYTNPVQRFRDLMSDTSASLPVELAPPALTGVITRAQANQQDVPDALAS